MSQKPIPAGVVAIRREICGRCLAQCASYHAGEIDYADPGASCPVTWSGQWHRYGRPGAHVRPAIAAERPSGITPSLLIKARRLGLALVKWARVGFSIAPVLQRRQRRAICHACPAYDRTGHAGLGACRDPRCGCTSLKRWLPTERCPQNKWPA
jgi:hypothetical protein